MPNCSALIVNGPVTRSPPASSFTASQHGRNKNLEAVLGGSSQPLHAIVLSSTSSQTAPPARSYGSAVTAHAVMLAADITVAAPPSVVAPLVDLSPAQVGTLMHLINNVTNKGDRMTGTYLSSHWILNIGASNLVTSDFTCLTHVTPIVECLVGLSDGTRAFATMEGRVTLTHGLILHHVLYVTQLNCNLISVSQMIDESNCHVQFTNSSCAIQDHLSGSLIRAGERRDGLYFFRGIPTVQVVTVRGLSEFELWHRRLGHPSDRVVKLVPAIKSNSSRKQLNKACIICRQAKETRDCFPTSDNKPLAFLSLYIVVCGAPIVLPLRVMLFIFSLWLMIIRMRFGCICYAIRKRLRVRLCLSLPWLLVNLILM